MAITYTIGASGAEIEDDGADNRDVTPGIHNAIRAIETLHDHGAAIDTRTDRSGWKRCGWWLDSVWLAPSGDPIAAVRAITGD